MNQIVEDAKTQLIAEAKAMLADQKPSDQEVAEIEWASGTLAFAGFSALSPVATDASAAVKSAYAVLKNIAARHAVTAQFDADKAMEVFIGNATNLLTKVATTAIATALMAA